MFDLVRGLRPELPDSLNAHLSALQQSLKRTDGAQVDRESAEQEELLDETDIIKDLVENQRNVTEPDKSLAHQPNFSAIRANAPRSLAFSNANLDSSRWMSDFKYFEQAALSVRDNFTEKQKFFAAYNTTVAPHLTSEEATFNIWAAILAYARPREGQVIRMSDALRGRYAKQYTVSSSVTKTVVAHFLTPTVKSQAGACIILFRGTSPNPAFYERHGQVCLEPTSLLTDTDPIGVGYFAYKTIRPEILKWVAQATRAGRNVVFVGHSLGGTLALRAMHDFGRNLRTSAYLYNPAGVDVFTRRKNIVDSKKRIVAMWHQRDLVSKCGLFPKMNGTEIVDNERDSYREVRAKGAANMARHGIPYAALNRAWGKTHWSRHLDYPQNPVIIESFANLARMNGEAGAVIADAVIRLKKALGR